MISILLDYPLITILLLFIFGRFIYFMIGVFLIFKENITDHSKRRQAIKGNKLQNKRIHEFGLFWSEIDEDKFQRYCSLKKKGNLNDLESFFLHDLETRRDRHIYYLNKPKKNPIESNPNQSNSTATIVKSIPKELIKEVKLENIKSKDEFYFVDYEVKKLQSVNTYPIFRFPKKGAIVRSYRIGNTKRRGYKEEHFQNSLEANFGDDFNILGNIRLNTGKNTRPFEPDIAIIDKSNSKIRIDIEIDEPYAGISRQPTHCIGEDINRDLYFIDRGWIVIRFSEYQIHIFENECLKFIADIIKSIIPNYKIPVYLLNQNSLITENFWDISQAQKWEKLKYREGYLNHTFQSLEEQPETIERDFDEQELKEEKHVISTSYGKKDNKKSKAFNLENTCQRDKRIKFYPESHLYTIDNTPATSASSIISKFFPEFDKYSAATRLNPNHELYGLKIEDIIKIWDSKGREAAKKGTFLHEQIENYFLNQEYVRTDEFHLFESFIKDNSQLIPYRTEWRIFDEEYHIAGTIDLISKNGNIYEMYDWKRSKKIVNTNNGEPIINNQWQKGIGFLSDIDDTSYNRYSLQQSIYRYILEKNYNIKVFKMYLVVLYPDNEKYYRIEVPYLKDRVELIFNTL